MKKIIIIFAFLLFIFISKYEVLADTSCNGRIFLHYHRYQGDYEHVELHVTGTGFPKETYTSTRFDSFGQVYEIPICKDADDAIRLSIQGKNNIPYKDGVDLDVDGIIDDKVLDVRNLKLGGIKHVYLLQGSKDTYDNFDNNQGGKLVIIYYDPDDNETTDVIVQGLGKYQVVPLSYSLGLDQSDNYKAFKMGIIDISPTAEEQVSFIIRNKTSGKDVSWIKQMNYQEYDVLGNIYKLNGERLINISEILHGGYKFVYLINGEKTIFTDYQTFLEHAFPLEIKSAFFPSKRTVSIRFNKPIPYDELKQLKILDNDGNEVVIENIAYNAFKLMDNKFNLLLSADIDAKKEYIITYVYEKDGEIQEVETEVTLGFTIIDEEKKHDEIKYPIIISGAIIITTLVTLLVILKRNK